MKITFYSIMLLVGIVLTIIRLMRNSNEKNAVGKIIKALETKPDFGNKLAEELIKKYDYKAIPENFSINQFQKTIVSGLQLDTHQINYIQKLSNHKFLLITTCNDLDVDVNMRGKIGDSKKTYNINYTFTHDEANQELILRSDQVSDGNQKGLRHSFARKLFEKLIKA